MRRCGECTLCCTLVPVRELGKLDNQRCRHQRFGKGCAIYHRRPRTCALWNCKWLTDPAAADLRRPDRSHYVIDPLPDYVRQTSIETGEVMNEVPALQVWVDPKHRDAHRDPALRAYLDAGRWVAIIRYGAHEGFVLVPPSVNGEGRWLELESRECEEHSQADINRVLAQSGVALRLFTAED